MTHYGLNSKLQLRYYLNAGARSNISKFRCEYLAKNIVSVSVILSVASKFHSEFLRLLRMMAFIHTDKYFNLVGDKEDIGS